MRNYAKIEKQLLDSGCSFGGLSAFAAEAGYFDGYQVYTHDQYGNVNGEYTFSWIETNDLQHMAEDEEII